MRHPELEERWLRRVVGALLGFGLGVGGVLGAELGEASSSGVGQGVMERLRGLSLEELQDVQIGTVYAASKRAQRITEAPASVSVVSADEIRKFGYRTLADVLRGVRGFYISQDRSYSYVGVRGINRPGDYGGRVLVLINGHRMNDPVYNSAANGAEFPFDLDLVERIEVVRGPGHSMYGDNAFLAVINVVPKTGAQLDGVEGAATAASQGDYSGRVSWGTRTRGGVEVLVSGTFRERAGHEDLRFEEYSEVNGGTVEGLDGELVRQFHASVGYDGFTFSGFYGERVKEVPTAQYEALFNLGPNWVRDRRWGLDGRLEREVGGEVQLLVRGYLDGYMYRGLGPYVSSDPSAPEPHVFNEDSAEALFTGVEAEVSRVCLERHRVSLGTEFRADLTLRQENWYHTDPEERVLDSSVSEERVAAYLQDEFSIRPNLILGGAVRYDHFESFGGTVNPRGSLIWSPEGGGGATFKALYAQAFRSPNGYERFYSDSGFLPTPGLEPERNHSYELVWEQGWGGPWRTVATVFHHDMSDFISLTQDADGNYRFANLDTVKSTGGEAEVEGRWEGGLAVRVSYTYAHTTESRPGMRWQRPANSPEHLVKAAVTVPVYRQKLFGSLEVQGMTGRRTVSRGEVSGFATANLVLFGRELLPGLELTAGIYNLLDRRYLDPVTSEFRRDVIEQDGRTFRVRVAYRY